MKQTLKEARLKAGVQQADIAAAIGVTISAVSQWESGLTAISARRLKQYCEIVGADIGDIIIPEPLSKTQKKEVC